MGISGGPYITRDSSLILELDAADNNSYISGSTIWRDLSSTIITGSLLNGPTFSSINNGSIVFDGTNQYVDGGSSSLLNFGTGNFTLCAWFKTNTSIRRTVLSRFDYDGTGTIERGYYIDILATGKIRTGFETNGTNYRITDSITSVNTNTYFFVTTTRTNTTTANVYINGIFETSNSSFVSGNPSNINVVTAPLSIGRRVDYQTPSFSNYFIGDIPLVQIYNRALSASEIAQNYNSQKSRFNL